MRTVYCLLLEFFFVLVPGKVTGVLFGSDCREVVLPGISLSCFGVANYCGLAMRKYFGI